MYSPASIGYAHGPATYGRPPSYGANPAYGRIPLYHREHGITDITGRYEHRAYSPMGLEGQLARLVSQDHGGFHPADFTTGDAIPEERDDSRLLALAREAFRATTGHELDDMNLSIAFCARDELRKHHGPGWSDGIMGFSRNRGTQGTSEVFVRHDTLDKLLLTLGHEIGHVLSPTLPDGRDEEAKAFAFSLAWMNAIVRENIAGLAPVILPRPAENGLHDVGLAFVQEHVSRGEDPLTIFRMLARQELSVVRTPELIILED